MRYTRDVCIIGGGLMGLCSVYYLTKAGKSVILLEKREIGNGASGSCDEFIVMQSKKPGVMLELGMESLAAYRELNSELDTDIGFKSRGSTILCSSEREVAVMNDYGDKQRKCGLDVVMLERKDLLKIHPHVGPSIVAGTYNTTDSQVDPMRFMRTLLARASARGAEVLRGVPVCGLERKGDHWQVSAGKDIQVECDSVLNACGAWAPEIGKLVGLDIPITPKRGQICITEQIPAVGKTNVLSASYIASKIDPSLMPELSEYEKKIGLGFAFSQTHDGNYLIGSSREHVGFDKTTDQNVIKTIINQACKYFPIIRSVNIIRTMSGFRPACADGFPIVSEVSSLPGFYICAGHEGDGVALAPISAKTITAMICGQSYDPRIKKLSFDRFM